MQNKKRYEIRKGILIFISIFILISTINIISAARLPTVGGDSGQWGTILNEFLNVSHNGSGELRSDLVSASQIVNGTITDTDISDTTNLTLGEKITFTFGGIIDNIVNGWIKITGGLNVTQNFTVGSSALFVDSSSGNVGIGTTVPNHTLSVMGDVNLNNTLYVNKTSGNVGIGTASPEALLDVGGDLLMRSTGEMTNTAQPAFLAHNSAAQLNATGDATYVTVNFATEIFDQSGNFATTIFTAPVDGKYSLSATVLLSNLDLGSYESTMIKIITSKRVYYYRGGGLIYDGGGNLALQLSVLADMDADDTAYVEVRVSGGAKTVYIYGGETMYTYFSGFLVC